MNRRVRTTACWALAGAALGGCALGERPTLTDPPAGGLRGQPVANADVNEVLTRLESPSASAQLIRYRILTKAGSVTGEVTVVRDSARLSVTDGDTRYLRHDAAPGDQVCTLTTGECVDGFETTRLAAATSLPADFATWGMGARLRLDLLRLAGDPIRTTREVAGVVTQCVEMPTGNGKDIYCVFDEGGLAFFDGADVNVEATEYQPDLATELIESSMAPSR